MIKVLLIEDDPWLLDLQARILEKEGFSVLTAPHAIAAMESIDKSIPDVIVTDVLLMGSTAFSLLNELQSHTDTKDIPVVLCTNIAENFDESQLKNYGVKRVVSKTTMHPSDIVAAVRASVGGGNEDN